MLLVIAVGASGRGRSCAFHVIEPLVLYPNLDIQLSVLVPNLLVGAANDYTCRETVLDTQRHLSLIHNWRLCCKAWKTIVDKSVEYNALRLAQHGYSIGPNALPMVCLPHEHNLIKLFQMNFMLFSLSRHATTKIYRLIFMSDLGDLSLRSLAKLRNELEGCWCAEEFYGMKFESFYPYWTCLADRV